MYKNKKLISYNFTSFTDRLFDQHFHLDIIF